MQSDTAEIREWNDLVDSGINAIKKSTARQQRYGLKSINLTSAPIRFVKLRNPLPDENMWKRLRSPSFLISGFWFRFFIKTLI